MKPRTLEPIREYDPYQPRRLETEGERKVRLARDQYLWEEQPDPHFDKLHRQCAARMAEPLLPGELPHSDLVDALAYMVEARAMQAHFERAALYGSSIARVEPLDHVWRTRDIMATQIVWTKEDDLMRLEPTPVRIKEERITATEYRRRMDRLKHAADWKAYYAGPR